MTDINGPIETALKQFASWLVESHWIDREHETVNAFTFGFLLPGMEALPWFEPGCIGREATVPNLPEGGKCTPGRRADLVIWPKPYSTTWKSREDLRNRVFTHYPAAILEWKTSLPYQGPCKGLDVKDMGYLTLATERCSNLVGYAITVDYTGVAPTLLVARFASGERFDMLISQ